MSVVRPIELVYTWAAKVPPEWLDAYQSWLTADEQARADRFVVERARRDYVIGRALVRDALAARTGVGRRAWRFVENAYGKPRIAEPEGTELEFNVSHGGGLVICAVGRGCQLGVDTEPVDRTLDHLGLADRYFAPSEAAAIRALPPDRRRDAFFEVWTLKEALIKACGRGLSMPLDGFAFGLSPGRPVAVAFTPAVAESPARWRFGRLRLAGRHRVAVAVRAEAAGPLAVSVAEVVPGVLAGEPRALPQCEACEWSLDE